MNDILDALAAQHDELRHLVAACEANDWQRATPCEGWDVGDVLLHLAQTDELAVASAHGELDGFHNGFLSPTSDRAVSVDDAAAAQVTTERAIGGPAIAARWDHAAGRLVEALRASDPHERVTWVSGKLSIHTLTATRLSECWIHTGDIAIGLGRPIVATDRLRHIARLAWRTLPYAFERAGLAMPGPVDLHLRGPHGDAWDFVGDSEAPTKIVGDAAEFCEVAARRVAPEQTGLVGTGPDAENVLRLVRTYAQ